MPSRISGTMAPRAGEANPDATAWLDGRPLRRHSRRMAEPLSLRVDDLSSEQTRGLLAIHLAGMHENTPAGHVFALDLSGLQVPEVTVWTAWRGDAIAGIAALKDLGGRHGELKSMRTHPDHLRQGVAAVLLAHIIGQ